ncbi:hypothetical protein CWO89_42520 [Bradyrhizobium sp. Leo170]|nr:hypothetical protein CWO90_45855 [Bradyrhizobium sp. Leo121]TAI60106.1 hypothetical protein CWO89_42520 [Bradyrhizobium sp. Leo170]
MAEAAIAFFGAVWARERTTVIVAKASMPCETWRCPPARSGFLVIKTKLVLGRFQAVLDGPAIAFH